MIAPLDTAALKALLAKATPGPWTREKPERDESGWPGGVAIAGTPGRQMIYASPPGGSFPSADCDLIAALRNNADALLSWIEAADALLAAVEHRACTNEEHDETVPLRRSGFCIACGRESPCPTESLRARLGRPGGRE